MKPWKKSLIEHEMDSIRDELKAVFSEHGPKARLEKIVEEIQVLEGDNQHLSNLRCFIFIVSALLHHAQYGGLRKRHIDGLITLGYALLKVQGVIPTSSKVSFLYGQLHSALSQIYRREGKHWLSAWELQVARQLSARSPVGGPSFQRLTSGIHSMRLGHANIASAEFSKADLTTMSDKFSSRVRLEHLKTLRLASNLSKADRLDPEYRAVGRMNADELKELQWEKLCRSAQSKNDIGKLVSAVVKGKPHAESAYAIELYFWTRMTRTRKWVERFPKMRSISQFSGCSLKKKDPYYQAAMVIEQVYDSTYPMIVRLRNLGKIIDHAPSLFSIDMELFVMAAAMRWLHRTRSTYLCRLVAAEYQSRSLQLSSGSSPDVLGMVTDILESSLKLTPSITTKKAA